MKEEILLSREEVTELMEDLNEWTEKCPPPYRFAEWAAILEHRLGLTELFLTRHNLTPEEAGDGLPAEHEATSNDA